MKTTVNLDVDTGLLDAAEDYAKRHNTNLSNLIEAYFSRLSLPSAHKNIVQLIAELEPSPLSGETGLIERYYEEQNPRHGR